MRRFVAAFPWHLTPIALLVTFVLPPAVAQVSQSHSSAVQSDGTPLFLAEGQAGIAPKPFTSFLERLASPASKILIRVAGDNLPADGVSGTDVVVELLDAKGVVLTQDVELTIEVDGGARVIHSAPAMSDSGAGMRDIDRIQPGIQALAKQGKLQFKLIAPFKPEAVNVRISMNGLNEKLVVRYVPELREMIAVGLLEARLRSDKFDPRQIVPVRENDGFDNELRGFTKDFNGGKSSFGARAAVYLKGKVKGDYLLTLAYDSDKVTRNVLFQDIDPNAFYPVYGDSSVRGVDAQSSGKLYVRVDNQNNHFLYGDYTTQDANPARILSQYSRSLTGLRVHYEEGAVTGNAFVAQQSTRQVIDEFPGRGVSGPYSVSNPNGISGSEKVEIVVRDRNQPGVLLKTNALTRSSDYEFEPFSGQILFRAPIPSLDDQLNPVSIRVTYEVEQGGEKFLAYGADVRLKLSDSLFVAAAAAKDQNPAAPYEVAGVNLQFKVSKNTEALVEVAKTQSVVNTGLSGFNTNTSSTFAGQAGEVSGSAGRLEVRHSDESLRLRGYVAKAGEGFNNSAAGITGGRAEVGASGAYKVNERLSLNAEVIRSEDSILNARSEAASLGVDLKFSDKLTLGAGVRRVSQDALTLVSVSSTPCSNPLLTASTGYNNGYGIASQGNQQIDPATGQLVQCAATSLPTAAAPAALDRTSLYVKGAYKLTEKVNLTGEMQKELGVDSTMLYRVGADWQVAAKSRLYARYEHARAWGGAYGLGVGEATGALALGFDTEYMQDGAVYSEYRLRDASAGREVQSALGLRNGWRLAEGLRLTTNVERTNSATGHTNALGAGLEYTASALWKGSGRIEWRQDLNNVNWLMTLGAARKLDRDWTLLARDYFSLVQPRTSEGLDSRQNRFQIGFAYRPVDNNQFDALGLYERKSDRNLASGTDTRSDIVSLRANYHPSRPWWVSGRYAIKDVHELLLGSIPRGYRAQLLGGRVTYDVTNRWSLGALVSVLQGKGGDRQYAYGLEVGYVVADNMLATLGYNWRGFSEADLTGSDYTNRGWVLGIRYKFDENLFRSSDPNVNKTLNPNVAPAKP